MNIGTCNSIGTTLTIITSDAYEVTMSTGMWSVPFTLNIVSEYMLDMYYYNSLICITIIQPNKIYCYNNEYKVIVLIICLYVIPQIITINTLTSRMLITGIALICD